MMTRLNDPAGTSNGNGAPALRLARQRPTVLQTAVIPLATRALQFRTAELRRSFVRKSPSQRDRRFRSARLQRTGRKGLSQHRSAVFVRIREDRNYCP